MIQNGKFALVHYTGTAGDGELFDSTDGREPFEFEVGKGLVIPAFEDARFIRDSRASERSPTEPVR